MNKDNFRQTLLAFQTLFCHRYLRENSSIQDPLFINDDMEVLCKPHCKKYRKIYGKWVTTRSTTFYRIMIYCLKYVKITVAMDIQPYLQSNRIFHISLKVIQIR